MSMGENYGRHDATTARVPAESGPIAHTKELLGYLEELRILQVTLGERLFGPVPTSACDEQPQRTSLDEMLLHACQEAAQSVDEAKSLLGRL